MNTSTCACAASRAKNRPDAVIQDSFFMVNDDAVKAFMGNLLVQRITIWQRDNGQPVMLSWNTPTDQSNVTARR
jgi:hypothetical protein